MSLTVHKPGLLDTVQDLGRHGYQHLGINPNGAMDRDSAAWANILVGNPADTALLELHFPASTIRFDQPALIALSGADFEPRLDDVAISIHAALLVSAGTVLTCRKRRNGARAYLAVHGGLDVPLWLGSASTNLKAKQGGWKGRRLHADDCLPFGKSAYQLIDTGTSFQCLIPSAPMEDHAPDDPMRILPGPEWDQLGNGSTSLLGQSFTITSRSDRMAMILDGAPVHPDLRKEMLSGPVTFGTMQLLPDGKILVLAADHQTTGGYPRIAHVISADLGRLVQRNPGESIRFEVTTLAEAQHLSAKQVARISEWQPVFSRQLRDALG